MSKTFKSAVTAGREVLVDRRTYGVFVRVIHEDRSAGTTIAAADAPALALAILEAAGVKPAADGFYDGGDPDYLGAIVRSLMAYLEHQTARAREAADREALYADAKKLFDARYKQSAVLWEDAQQAEWFEVARTAREMYGAKS